MPSCDPFRQTHKRLIVDSLIDQYSDLSESNYFFGIGKISPWSVTGSGDIPPASVDSVFDDTSFWRSLFAAQRINRSDVSLVVRRVDWEAGKIFIPYRDTIDLFDDRQPADFYALVDEDRVYVCIDNNYDSPSLYPPSHTDPVVRKLADGYRWKFLYQIPESRRKFLTKTRVGSIGYMPVEYIESLRTNDDRELQWNVQRAAVNGKIEFAYINEEAKAFWVTTESVVLPSSGNVVVNTVPSGATGVIIASPTLSPSEPLYKDMIISFDTGPGQGQKRQIKNFQWLGTSAKITIDPLVLGLSGNESATADNQSYWSILPRIVVDGDGRKYSNPNNPDNTTAEFTFKFGGTAALETTGGCSFTARFINSLEVVDGGQDYTFADLSVTKGLTTYGPTPLAYQDISRNLNVVIPPPGGHGANPVKELGAAAIMIVKEFERDENGAVDVGNEFRQFGIIRNPLLREKQIRIKFYEPGLSGSFAVGASATQIDGAYGTVLEWCPGMTGVTASSQLVLGDIRGGTFAAGMTVTTVSSPFRIFDVTTKTVAGSEGRHLLKLTMIPNTQEFSSDGKVYRRMHFAHGVGYQPENIPQSRSSGEIFSWEQSSNNLYGYLCLENPKGTFNLGETLLQTDPYFGGSDGLSGPGRVNAVETDLEGIRNVYDLTTTMSIVGTSMTKETFYLDERVSFAAGLTVGYGFIMDWASATGGTSGILRLSGVQGIVQSGQTLSYISQGTSGTTSEFTATVDSVSHLSEFKYRSGEVIYIQNVKPILRDIEQREEFKVVIEL